MEIVPSESYSFIKLLKVNREHLVTHIRNTQCLLDNLLQNDYFSTEDAEIVCACPTQPDKVLVTGGQLWWPDGVKSFESSVHWVIIYRTEITYLISVITTQQTPLIPSILLAVCTGSQTTHFPIHFKLVNSLERK